MKKIIALTGATGFVGRHLLNLLASQGYNVNALTRRPQKNIENVKWILGDLDSASALNELVFKADVIINVAGLVKAKNLDEFRKANSDAIQNILTATKSIGSTPHFIQISSLAARKPDISDYARSKFEGEEVIKNNSINIDWTIIRPPGIYGPADTETLKIFSMLKWRLALYPANRQHRVSWIYVLDLVNAISNIIENNNQIKKIIEIDDGKENGYSHEEFFNISSNLLGISPVKITIPQNLLKAVGHINDIFGNILGYVPMVSSKKTNELCHEDWVCRKELAFKNTEWKAEYDLNEGLKETLDWYKNNEYI